MKIFSFGLDIEPGKYKYKGECFDKLVKKFSPQKVSPFTVEFINDDIDKSDAVVFSKDKKLDLILIDLEKIEKRLAKDISSQEKETLDKAQILLEQEKTLSEGDFSQEQESIFKTLQMATIKPSLEKNEVADMDALIREVISKSGLLLFFTAGKKEVHTWAVKKGETILEAAGKIHSDLKRGFIKGDVVNCSELNNFFNMAEARSKGLMKVVDRDYIMQENDIIEIRFSV
ncbi:MAG: DUF933 domain-containing protein [Candidatus Omnitrophica bacterium]|nr:DUF933 domain-containing protein [Candidatus Omnitrophota bacterium]MDD5429987.1 DUF933 domain-containing protein [Candidatus Omnitrophota bacterium]